MHDALKEAVENEMRQASVRPNTGDRYADELTDDLAQVPETVSDTEHAQMRAHARTDEHLSEHVGAFVVTEAGHVVGLVRLAKSVALTLLVATMLVFAAPPGQARAHGRPPYLERIAFDPGNDLRVVAQTSFGLVVSEDGGTSWRWVCSAVYRADPTTEDPDVVVADDGGLVVGAFDGAARGSPDLCEWTFPDGPARRVFVVDLERDPFGSAIWGVTSTGTAADVVVRSEDMGLSWVAVGPPIEDVLIESMARAASDSGRVYLGGAIPIGAEPRQGFVLRSEDAGESYTPVDLPLDDGERFPLIVAVDPTDADRVFVRVTRRATDIRPERLLYSDDGALSFREVFRLRGMRAVALSEDGQRLWVGSAQGEGLHLARGGSFDFERMNDVDVRCVEVRGDELWLCIDPHRNDFALGRSIDEGATVEPLLRLQDVELLPECPACSATGFTCPAWQDDLAFDQDQYFGSGMPPPGGATGQPRDAGDIALCGAESPPTEMGCGCRVVRPAADLPIPFLFALWALTRRVRRRAERT
ncbi:MAG: hypothetical protein KC619_22015 [Myxococcales bacterium]|nr:hypothetical protein [Myxococcales bacterium]